MKRPRSNWKRWLCWRSRCLRPFTESHFNQMIIFLRPLQQEMEAALYCFNSSAWPRFCFKIFIAQENLSAANGYLIKQQQLLLMWNSNYCAVAGHCTGTSEQDGSAERSQRLIPSRVRDGGGDAASDRFVISAGDGASLHKGSEKQS